MPLREIYLHQGFRELVNHAVGNTAVPSVPLREIYLHQGFRELVNHAVGNTAVPSMPQQIQQKDYH